MESVDQAGRRERFMQTNFESLSGKSEICNWAIIWWYKQEGTHFNYEMKYFGMAFLKEYV